MTNQIALLLEFARLDQCKTSLTQELLDIDNLPDAERQKFYDEKEQYYRNKPKIVVMYNWYWVYEKDPNAKTPKFADQWETKENKEDDDSDSDSDNDSDNDSEIDEKTVEELKEKEVRVLALLKKLRKCAKNGWKL